VEEQEGQQNLHSAVVAWYEYTCASLTSPMPNPTRSLDAMASRPEWDQVRDAVRAVAGPQRRPDLYAADRTLRGGEPLELSDRDLLEASGLAWAVRAASTGRRAHAGDVAGEVVRFCLADMPRSENWLLLDGSFPRGCQVPVVGFTLQTFTSDELDAMKPTGLLAGDARFDLPTTLLDGAAFLHCVVADRRPKVGAYFPVIMLRPEAEFWEPLVTISLWRCEPLHLSALFTVERGRQVLREVGEVTLDYRTDGQEEWEVLQLGGFAVDDPDLAAFTAFCDVVGGRVLEIGNENTRKKTQLTQASIHLVRASHRTLGRDFIWDEEVDELITHYVIAIEALLSDPDHGDLTRKVQQRAAALWLTDDSRLEVARLVKKAYGVRSQYAHGSVTKPLSYKEINQLRRIAHQVMLRWLVLAGRVDNLPVRLDESLLSRTLHRSIIEVPLREFFADTPPAILPADLVP
jgi:Apea-like HEPN